MKPVDLVFEDRHLHEKRRRNALTVREASTSRRCTVKYQRKPARFLEEVSKPSLGIHWAGLSSNVGAVRWREVHTAEGAAAHFPSGG